MDKMRFPLRKSGLCLSLMAVSFLLLILMFIHAAIQRQIDGRTIDRVAETARNLELTDLSLFTEASYIRHLSQADFQAAFQDHPLSLEHFPTGAIAVPTQKMKRLNGQLD